jgi:hypothetical protein
MAISFSWEKVAEWETENNTTFDVLYMACTTPHIAELARVGGGVATPKEAYALVDVEIATGKSLLDVYKGMVYASCEFVIRGREIADSYMERLDRELENGIKDHFAMLDAGLANPEIKEALVEVGKKIKADAVATKRVATSKQKKV